MPILTFNNANDAAAPDDVHINSSAVRFIEAARADQKGQTMIYLLGQGDIGIPLVEPIEGVIAAVGGLAAVTRHYLAGAPGGHASTVYVSIANISSLRPNKQSTPPFWYMHFVDGFELRILDPLPPTL